MNTLACFIGPKSKDPFLRSSDTPHYRKLWSSPPLHRHLEYRVVIEESGEVVYKWKPEKPNK